MELAIQKRTVADTALNEALYRKIMWRIVPFIFMSYIINQIDRTNIAFAKLKFMSELGLSDAAYGFGAGLFFIGYVIFEVPSNIYLHRAGARRTFVRIMVLWGLLSMAMSLIQTPTQFYIGRFLLGAAEAGFVPGVVLYLTYWFPPAHRGKISSFFFLSIAFSGIFGGPISGLVMRNFDGALGLKDWQWLFVIEGLPAVMLGVIAYFWLDDRPANAKWLTTAEKAQIQNDLARHSPEQDEGGHRLFQALRDPRVYVSAVAYFSIIAANNVLTLWLPTIIKDFGTQNVAFIGLLSAVPYCVGAIGMVFVARSSDQKQERRWHVALMMLLTALSYVLLGRLIHSPVVAMSLLAVAAIGIYASMSIFWTIPQTYLSGASAATGIALVSSLGMLGGFFSPIIMGYAKTEFGDLGAGFWAMAALLAIGAVTILVGIRSLKN